MPTMSSQHPEPTASTWFQRCLPQLKILLLATLGLSVAAFLTSGPFTAPISGWNDMRLAPSAYLLNDVPLYGTKSDPGLTTLYGPTPALIFAPSLIANNPVSAIRLGQVIAYLLGFITIFLPLWCVSARAGFDKTSDKILLGLIGMGIALTTESIFSGLFIIHADTPALFFITLAGAALTFPSKPKFILASLCGVMAVGCKITYALAPMGLCLCLFAQAGWKTAFRFALTQAVVVLAAIALVVLKYDAFAVWDGMVTVPSGHPWKFLVTLGETHSLHTGTLWKLICAGQTTVLYVLKLMVFIVAVPLLYPIATEATRHSPGGESLKRWRNCCLGLVLALFPVAILGYTKEGGGLNAAAGVSLFLFHLGFALVLPILKQAPKLGPWLAAATILGFVTALRLFNLTAQNIYQYRTADGIYADIETSLKSHPGELWFGARPLAHWYYERRAVHSADVIFSRRLAGESLPSSWISSRLPEKTKAIVGFKYDSWIALGSQSVRPGLKPIAIEGLPASVISYGWPAFGEALVPPL